ncbi:MAG: hypothetical protein Q9196_001393 [Gyalolechia fulgens]
MIDHIRLFCDQLVRKTPNDHDGWTQARNVKDLCRLPRGIGSAPTNCNLAGNWVAFDIGGDFVYRQKFRTLVTEEKRYLNNAILALNIRGGMHAQCPKLARFYLELLWPPIDLRTFRKCVEWRRSFGEKLKGQGKATRGLFFKTLGVEDPETGKDVSFNKLLAEAQFLQVAAFETTATTLAAALFYLAHYSDAYSHLAREIRTTFAAVEEIRSGPKLNSCKYLSACIQETLRMSPTVPGAMWREAEPGGAYVDQEFIPAGYDIATCIYALHHNESYFEDSFNFSPNRWLSAGSGEVKSRTECLPSVFLWAARLYRAITCSSGGHHRLSACYMVDGLPNQQQRYRKSGDRHSEGQERQEQRS